MRIFAAIFGIVLLAGVVALGFFSGKNSAFLVGFGLASAIAAPVGITALTYAIRGRSQRVMEELSKVPEVQRLIEEAKTREEQIKILENERQKLNEIIASEAQRQALLTRRSAADDQARILTREIDIMDSELDRLGETPVGGKISRDAVNDLRRRIKAKMDGDFVIQIAGRTLVLEKELFLGIPMGNFMYQYLRMIRYLLQSLKRIRIEAEMRKSK